VVAAYREAVRLAPQDATARWRLGDALLYGLGKPDAACASLREAVRLDSRLAGAHLSLGVALNAAGAHAEAVSAFDEALRLDPRIFENHPVARAALEASRRGRRWTP
jgi:tetratricopeptide (TPR) repeat protein